MKRKQSNVKKKTREMLQQLLQRLRGGKEEEGEHPLPLRVHYYCYCYYRYDHHYYYCQTQLLQTPRIRQTQTWWVRCHCRTKKGEGSLS